MTLWEYHLRVPERGEDHSEERQAVIAGTPGMPICILGVFSLIGEQPSFHFCLKPLPVLAGFPGMQAALVR